jgi:hypothetical protein
MSCVWDHRLLPRLHTHSTKKRTPIFLHTAYVTGRKPGERVTNTYYDEPRPVRKIPTRQQIDAAAQRQAILEARRSQQPSHHHIGSNSGFHPEEDEEILDEDWPPRLPTSTRRYQVSPEQVYQQGNQRLHVRYVDVPKRSSQQKQLPPQHPRDRYTDEVETTLPKAKQHKRSIHPMLYLGVGMLAMLALVVLMFSGWNWLQIKMDDIMYGRPRTFQTDAVVGHNDSPANPSHFIAINLYRHVEVIEIPGQDTTKMKVYNITTLFGDGQDLTPVTLSFHDVTGDGKPDMLIHIQDTVIAMINDNGTFRPAKPGEVKGIL